MGPMVQHLVQIRELVANPGRSFRLTSVSNVERDKSHIGLKVQVVKRADLTE